MTNQDNHIKQAAKSRKEAELPHLYLLDQFQAQLNAKPKNVATNTHQGNYKYLPISYVQTKLNEIFKGRVQTKNFTWTETHMQLCGTVELHVFHPYEKIWIVKTGCAATQIRCNRQTKEPINNGISMDLPRLLADCIKNAAKQLGKAFGADLNRKEEDHYNAQVVDYVNKNGYNTPEIIAKIAAIDKVIELYAYWDSLNAIEQSDPKIKSAFDERSKDIQDTTF